MRMKKAVQAVWTGKVKSVYRAAKDYGVHRNTLGNQLKTGKTRQTVRESQQLLSGAEEKVLKKWCTHLTQAGYSASLVVLKEMAETIIVGCVFKVRNPTLPIKQPRPIPIDWAKRFYM
jgi:hypothetical protein